MTFRQDPKMMLACLTSDEARQFISNSMRTGSQGGQEPPVAQLCHSAGGSSAGWMQCVVGYFRIHLLCVISG